MSTLVVTSNSVKPISDPSIATGDLVKVIVSPVYPSWVNTTAIKSSEANMLFNLTLNQTANDLGPACMVERLSSGSTALITQS
jgi:hypothetical protein